MATKSSSEKPDLRAQLAEELIKRVEQGTAVVAEAMGSVHGRRHADQRHHRQAIPGRKP